jgi:hypothetical protein
MATIKQLMGTGTPALQAQQIVGAPATLAGVGTSQSGAAQISAPVTTLTTAGGATAAVLPTGSQGSIPGDEYFIFTSSATTGIVYPGGTDTANGSTSGINVAQNKMLHIKRLSSTAWGYLITA